MLRGQLLVKRTSSRSGGTPWATTTTRTCFSTNSHTSAIKKVKQNMVEKIVQKYASGIAPGEAVRSGDYVSIVPLHVMTHDNTSAVMQKFFDFFKSKSEAKIANKRQVVFTLDHDIQNKSPENLKKYESIQKFAKEQGVDFYPAGRGIGHQVMCEEGYAWPGTLVVASDSHSNMYGGLGCLGTPVVRTDAAAIWATGKTWWQVPAVTKVILSGSLAPGVTGKDVIITLCGLFNKDEVLNDCIEFGGDGVENLSIDERLTIANMTTEWGSLAGVFPVDRVTFAWLRARERYLTKRGPAGVPSDADLKTGQPSPRINSARISLLEKEALAADEGASYSKVIHLDLGSVRPYVSGPNHVKVMAPASELAKKKIKINKAYIVSCVNSRVGDLEAAAKVLKGRKVAEGVELYISAASSEVQRESENKGDWQSLVDAGAKILPPGCGPCIGLGVGLLQKGEVGISATNRNFKGRMGSTDAIAYLASPAVVAASAINGYISGLAELNNSSTPTPAASINLLPSSPSPPSLQQLTKGFPSKITGPLVFCHQDNLNTDGIYPGKYTYKENISPEQQAQVVMENYDPEFAKIVPSGVVSFIQRGFNFGTGSSREQAATALKHKGVKVLLAGSFSETFKRNALNNGFLCVEVPQLVNDLKAKFTSPKPTILTQLEGVVDFVNSKVEVKELGKTYTIGAIGQTAQELILTGGLESWVKESLRQKEHANTSL